MYILVCVFWYVCCCGMYVLACVLWNVCSGMYVVVVCIFWYGIEPPFNRMYILYQNFFVVTWICRFAHCRWHQTTRPYHRGQRTDAATLRFVGKRARWRPHPDAWWQWKLGMFFSQGGQFHQICIISAFIFLLMAWDRGKYAATTSRTSCDAQAPKLGFVAAVVVAVFWECRFSHSNGQGLRWTNES